MQDDLAIKVDSVSKTFKLPHEKQSTIKSTLINFARGKKGYETQEALKNVSFEVKKGDFFGIVGRNGSGKSTLLKLLAGIYSPTKGDIGVNGKLTPFIELGVGFNPELSGRDNVYLNGALLGFNRKEMDAMYQDIVDFAEIEKFMDQKLKNYSSGMQVRLAFSIAIRAKGDILLLDEVLAVGDAAFQQKCFNYFSQLKEEKRTVVFVSHDMSSLRKFCDKGILIDKGKLIYQGNASEVADVYLEKVAFEINSEPSKGARNIVKSINLKSASKMQSGDELKLQIKASSKKSTKVLLAVSILHNGQYVAGINTKGFMPITLNPAEKEFNLTLKLLGLAAGKYNLGYSVFDEEEERFLQERMDGPEIVIEDTEHKENIDGTARITGEWLEVAKSTKS